MEIFKEDLEKYNLMFTDDLKKTTLSISEFLSNPNYYKIMWRTNSQVCLKILKSEDSFIVGACVLNTLDGGLIVVAHNESYNLFDAIAKLNGTRNLNKIDKKMFDAIQRRFDDKQINMVDFINSEKEKQIKGYAYLNKEIVKNKDLEDILNKISLSLAMNNRNIK